jgi:hypothetical protein
LHPLKISYLVIVACICLTAAGLLKGAGQTEAGQTAASSSASPQLDYEFFKTKVQPIFQLKRPGHARCFLCHADSNVHAPLKLVPLTPGATTWDEEQTRQNFELVKAVAIPGDLQSPLLTHPLAPEAGGDYFHTGGRQFLSQTDPSWLTFKAFILGEKASSRP